MYIDNSEDMQTTIFYLNNICYPKQIIMYNMEITDVDFNGKLKKISDDVFQDKNLDISKYASDAYSCIEPKLISNRRNERI